MYLVHLTHASWKKLLGLLLSTWWQWAHLLHQILSWGQDNYGRKSLPLDTGLFGQVIPWGQEFPTPVGKQIWSSNKSGKNLQEAIYWIILSSSCSWTVHAQITMFSTGFTIQNTMSILASNTFSFIDYFQITTPSYLQGILVMWEDSSHVPSITQKHGV